MFNRLELFDAYDIHGKSLGYDLVRGMPIPDNVYHYVVEIYTFDHQHDLLVTKRHPNKFYPLYWEVTAGAVLKGEKPLEAAVRELKEETGLSVSESDLICVSKIINDHCFIVSYMVCIDSTQPVITLEDNETIAYQWIPFPQINSFINRADFVPTSRKRIINNLDFIHKNIK